VFYGYRLPTAGIREYAGSIGIHTSYYRDTQYTGDLGYRLHAPEIHGYTAIPEIHASYYRNNYINVSWYTGFILQKYMDTQLCLGYMLTVLQQE
jgi:hypothetical protein